MELVEDCSSRIHPEPSESAIVSIHMDTMFSLSVRMHLPTYPLFHDESQAGEFDSIRCF